MDPLKAKLWQLNPILRFSIITIAIHFLWRFWEYDLHYMPIENVMHKLSLSFVRILYCQSSWIISHLVYTGSSCLNQTIYLGSHGQLEIFEGCSGLKQFAQFGLLITMCHGRWFNKAWFIPAGIVIIHMTNIVRIVGSSLVIIYLPEYWHFGHNIAFKAIFYAVIFTLWVVWTDYFAFIRVQKMTALFHCHQRKC
jgi:exosortase/archaeosortase family protein